VNGRTVETEFVFGRHWAADLPAAYAILIPQRKARIPAIPVEGRMPDDKRGDLGPGIQRPAEERPDDRLADRSTARARHS
jgi:hypothetical protein